MSRNPQPWAVKLLSQPSLDTDPAFLITFDDSKYLFNCPENTTRTIIQRKYGFNKYRAIFLSRISSETSAGLPGFIMSLADSGTKDLVVHGPSGLSHFLASSRFYLIRDNLRLEAVEHSNEPLDPTFDDGNLRVYAIPIAPSSSSQFSATTLPETSGSRSLKRRRSSTEDKEPVAKRASIGIAKSTLSPERRLSRVQRESGPREWRLSVIKRMFPGEEGPKFRAEHEITSKDLRKRLPTWKARRIATSYLAVGPEYRGRFNVQAADALGVKKGPDRAKLSRGESVLAQDGTVITPDMVLGPSSPAAAFLIVDCPSEEFISGLLASARISDLVNRKRQCLHCVFHIAPPSVMENPLYCQWMASLGDDVHHIVANDTLCPDRITFTASEAMQKCLSSLDAHLFRVPWTPSQSSSRALYSQLPINIIPAQNQIVCMRPLADPISPSENTAEATDAEQSFSFKGAREKIEGEISALPASPGDDVTISCLGTGSAMPAKYRNVSATLVQIPGSGNILLDCGEGTWGQMRRHFGLDVDSVLRQTKCIFLSHVHADHHMGVSRILFQRRKLSPPPQDPIYLICPRNVWTYLSEYGEIEDTGVQDVELVCPIFCEEIEHRMLHNRVDRPSWTALKLLSHNLGVEEIKTASVEHKTMAFGLIVKHADGWSFTYSGDTKPCQNLVDAGSGSTLLIHEATMADDQVIMAAEKAHSTVGQAMEVARRMHVRKLLLTHFSTRYPKVPVLGPRAPESTSHKDTAPIPETFVSFDFLHIRLGDFARAERYLTHIESAFGDLKEHDVTLDTTR